jgi:TorA maturation chaperone TorD
MNPEPAEIAFLGQVFLKPDPQELGAVATELGLAGWQDAVADDAARLEVEYNRLFLNPLGTPCPPWQSANTNEQRLMGETHLSALEWFRQFDVEPAAMNEPADHVGLLLLFYAHLLEADVSSAVLEQFTSQHLDWMPEFCATVGRATTLDVYRAVCERLQEVLVRGNRPALRRPAEIV